MNKIEKNNIFKINWENNICTINLDSNHFESPWENCILFKYNNNIYKGTFCNIEHYFYIDQINKLVHIFRNSSISELHNIYNNYEIIKNISI
jgi:hypothetical protein